MGYSPTLANELRTLEEKISEYQQALDKLEQESKVEFRKPTGEEVKALSSAAD